MYKSMLNIRANMVIQSCNATPSRVKQEHWDFKASLGSRESLSKKWKEEEKGENEEKMI